MRYFGKLAAIFSLAAGLLSWAGCGSSDTSAVTASIGSASATQAAGAAGQPGSRPLPRLLSRAELLHPKVLIQTSLGDITLELDAEKAPLTVDNFLAYIDRGHYDQTIFHQVWKNYVILGGSYDAKLAERRCRAPIMNEAHKALKNTRGTIAMAHRPNGVDTAACQFFINVRDNPSLDHKDRTLAGYGYCAFGRVTSGLEVIDKIANVDVHNVDQFEQVPVEPVLVRSVRRIP
jgi:cyclophilin family peptidyl-prolyl cis-trans isomerase